MKVVLLEGLGISAAEMADFEQKICAMGNSFVAYAKTSDIELQKSYTADADVIIIANMPLSGEVIRNAKNLKFINVAFTGVDHVDLVAARECGVAVSNASGYSTQSVAEIALCMMLELLRNVKQTEIRCRNAGTKDGLVGSELAGKTVGVIGSGAIGMRVAKLCEAFGCKVLAYRRNPQEDGLTYCSLEDLLKNSDIVTLHCPANESTKNLINAERLAMMKPTALLINTARGAVVNQEDLRHALDNDIIAGAGLDVFDIEPPLACDHVLLGAKNTIVTPHIAFATKESMIFRKEIVLDNLVQWANGTQINVV